MYVHQSDVVTVPFRCDLCYQYRTRSFSKLHHIFSSHCNPSQYLYFRAFSFHRASCSEQDMCCNALSLFPPDAFRISHRFLPASICCICFVTARSFLRRVPGDNAEHSLPLFLHIRSNKVFLVQLYPCSKYTSRTFSASHDVLCNNYLLTLLFTAFNFFPSCQLINAIATVRL